MAAADGSAGLAPVRVTAVLAVHDRRAVTLACLRSLEAARAEGIDLEIVVVDDGSTDDTAAAIVEQHPNVLVLRADGSLFYTAATNVGIRAALSRGVDYVLVMNDDCVVPAGLLRQLVTTATRHPRAVIGATLVRDDDGRLFQVAPRWRLAYGGWQYPTQLMPGDLPPEPFAVALIVGNCLLVPRAAIEDVGLLPAYRVRYDWADAGWTSRMRSRGWRLLVDPAAALPCQPSPELPSLRSRGARGALRVLFVDRGEPLHLGSQLRLRWLTAPSAGAALAVFGVYLGRLAGLAFGVGDWPRWTDPPDPLTAPPASPLSRHRRFRGDRRARP